MTEIIGISGKKQSGKTTLSDYINCCFTVYSSLIDNNLLSIEFSKKGLINYLNNLEQTEDGKIYDLNCSMNKNSHEALVFHRSIEDGNLRFKQGCSYGSIYYFADSLKSFAKDTLGLTESQVNGSNEEKNSLTKYSWDNIPDCLNPNGNKSFMSSRQLLQFFGTDICRNLFSEDIWVESTFRAIQKNKPMFAIIPDVRFESELNFVIKNNGYIIRLERDVYDDNHPSETALDNYDWNSCENALVIPKNLDMISKNRMVIDWIFPLFERVYRKNKHSSDKRFYPRRISAFHEKIMVENDWATYKKEEKRNWFNFWRKNG